jgi:hypothetical protein
MAIDLRAAASGLAPAVAQLPHLAGAARATWLGRMVNEYASSRVFDGLAAQLQAAGFDAARVAQCRAFADEERRHGILCGAVVQALGGSALAEDRPHEPFPLHADVQPVEGVLRNVLSVSCLSETVAVSLIGAERLAMPSGELRNLLTRIWADEIGHARFGWLLVREHLLAMAAVQRRRLTRYMVVAFEHLERHELTHLPLDSRPPPEGAALGLCNGVSARRLFYATVEEVIVPRLEALGLAAADAWEKAAGGRQRPDRSPQGLVGRHPSAAW